MKNPTIDLNELSTDDLEKFLSQRKEAEAAQQKEKRNAYENKREAVINTLGSQALSLRDNLSAFKSVSMAVMADFRGDLLEYGDLRRGEKNKGSFEIKNERFKINFKTHINKAFDERAELAESKLKEFLASFVKKRDQKMYKIILSLLERDEKSGDFDIDLINRLYKMEADFDDPRWKDALRLFKESYSPTGTARYITFSHRLENGTWESLVLDFAKLKADATQNTETATTA